MARFSVPNLRNYTNHLSRGVLLIIGALVILGLVAATYFYGDTARDDAANNDVDVVQNGDPAAPGVTDNDFDANGEAAPETDENESEEEVVGPDMLADTGPMNYGLIVIALVALAALYRHSSRQLEAAFVKTR